MSYSVTPPRRSTWTMWICFQTAYWVFVLCRRRVLFLLLLSYLKWRNTELLSFDRFYVFPKLSSNSSFATIFLTCRLLGVSQAENILIMYKFKFSFDSSAQLVLCISWFFLFYCITFASSWSSFLFQGSSMGRLFWCPVFSVECVCLLMTWE